MDKKSPENTKKSTVDTSNNSDVSTSKDMSGFDVIATPEAASSTVDELIDSNSDNSNQNSGSNTVIPDNVENIEDEQNKDSFVDPERAKKLRNVEEFKKQKAAERKRKKRKKIFKICLITFICLIVAGLISAFVYFYYTDDFKIHDIKINGADHLTRDEVLQISNVPEDTTLLRVDTDTIIARLKQDSWIKNVEIDREFPSTLVINITERSITAIAEVPTSANQLNPGIAKDKDSVNRYWAISADYMWLMPIPEKNSEYAKNINQRIYQDVEGVMHIVDVSPSVSPEIGTFSKDQTVNCAIDVVAAMTTDLKNRVKKVKAADTSSTNLILNNGVEVAIGTSDDLRNKERVCLELLDKYDGKIAYINVRNASSPTWRMI